MLFMASAALPPVYLRRSAKSVIELFYQFGLLHDGRKHILYPAEACRQVQPFLVFQQLALRPLDGIPHALPGNAAVRRYLRQGKILIVVQLHHIPLLIGQHIAVKIQQKGYLQVFCHAAVTPVLPPCKADFFTVHIIPYSRSSVKRFSLHCQKKTVFLWLFAHSTAGCAVFQPPVVNFAPTSTNAFFSLGRISVIL